MSYTWREVVLDNVILKAHENGFKDKDFDGWTDLPETARRHAVKLILQNNGVGQIIFRRSFAQALWGYDGFPGEFTGKYKNPLHSKNLNHSAQKGWEHHIQQMVIADDWLQYLKDNT